MAQSLAPTIHVAREQSHLAWDNSIAPIARVASGAVVAFDMLDAAGGQITADSTVAAIGALDFSRVDQVNGPIFVEGAEPGDTLQVELLEFQPAAWGWTALIPGFGLLADEFPQPALRIWTLADGWAEFAAGVRIPLAPFCGEVGLAPAEAGAHSTIPPYRHGGNMDTKHLTAGATLYLPVEVPGALYSMGDGHAAQGDGEVCGTAIETAMDIALKFELVKGVDLPFPRFTTPGPVSRHFDVAGYEVTTGIGPDLMRGARDAVKGMVDLLSRRHGMKPVEAYMLCSVCADLRISSIVDMPNWVVSLYFPRVVLE
jgi:acetamidase/formamidase